MVRFARAEGSKGSNKRVLEDATPWSEMVAQMKKNKPDESIEDIGLKKEEKKTVEESNFLNRFQNVIEKPEPEDEEPKEDTAVKEETVSKRKTKKKQVLEDSRMVTENGQKFHVSENGTKRQWFELPYEENDQMTRYEGFWIKSEMLKKLNELRETLSETLDADTVRKRMMKAKRKAHKELTRELILDQKKAQKNLSEEENVQKCKEKDTGNENSNQRYLPQKNDDEEKLERVLFDGYWVTKEGATRLNKLRADLLKKRVSREELRRTMKGERRKEEKALRRETKRVCLRCRRRGHVISECPDASGRFGIEQNCICYGCGSTEHKVNDCPKGGKGEEFPLATCFICRQVGHISRQCPDNPRGLYPNGGSCRGCGSVLHLAANCPVIQTQQEKDNMKLDRIDGNALESLDIQEQDFSAPREPSNFRNKKAKIILFD